MSSSSHAYLLACHLDLDLDLSGRSGLGEAREVVRPRPRSVHLDGDQATVIGDFHPGVAHSFGACSLVQLVRSRATTVVRTELTRLRLIFGRKEEH